MFKTITGKDGRRLRLSGINVDANYRWWIIIIYLDNNELLSVPYTPETIARLI